MSHPLTRVLTLLELLQSNVRLTGAELADRLDTDVRTVRRYMSHLRDLGIPVEAERGRYGGYRLARGYRMPPLVLTNDEALAVVLGLLAAERLGMGTAAPASAGALAKIERVLPQALREPLAAMRETLSFTANAVIGQAPGTGVLLALAQASRACMTVGISHQSWRQEHTERDIDPYGVVFHTGRWYVVGHDHLRDSLRTFRIDRIASVTSRADSFTAPDGFDPVAHLTSTLARAAQRSRASNHVTRNCTLCAIPTRPSGLRHRGTCGARTCVLLGRMLPGIVQAEVGTVPRARPGRCRPAMARPACAGDDDRHPALPL